MGPGSIAMPPRSGTTWIDPAAALVATIEGTIVDRLIPPQVSNGER